jgi:hypothetical protein
LWLSTLESHFITGTPLDPVARVVIAVDGVILLPLLFYAGRALARREPIGYALAGLLLVKATATFGTLLASSVMAARWGHATDTIQSAAFAIGLVIAATLLTIYLRSIRPMVRV